MHLNLIVVFLYIFGRDFDFFSTCIGYLSTNKVSCFQNNQVFEIGISDLHDVVVTVIKLFLRKITESCKAQKQRIIIFNNKEF